jgi:hypothetical protein
VRYVFLGIRQIDNFDNIEGNVDDEHP